jgi:hypothetical protein
VSPELDMSNSTTVEIVVDRNSTVEFLALILSPRGSPYLKPNLAGISSFLWVKVGQNGYVQNQF